jgi:hypothetical protein
MLRLIQLLYSESLDPHSLLDLPAAGTVELRKRSCFYLKMPMALRIFFADNGIDRRLTGLPCA